VSQECQKGIKQHFRENGNRKCDEEKLDRIEFLRISFIVVSTISVYEEEKRFQQKFVYFSNFKHLKESKQYLPQLEKE
jgi:hypothetical protein